MEQNLKNAILKGVEFLKSGQLISGEFPSKKWIGDDAHLRVLKDFPPRKSVFLTSFVLHSLTIMNECEFVEIEKLARQAIDFLLEEKEEYGLWRFGGKESEMPFDIDCTACILSALKEWNNINKEWNINLDYEKIATNLLKYQNDKRIFNTWILDMDSGLSKIWHNDVDWVVNANILNFYTLLNWNLINVKQYLEKIIETEEFKKNSIYYPSISGIYCFINATLR